MLHMLHDHRDPPTKRSENGRHSQALNTSDRLVKLQIFSPPALEYFTDDRTTNGEINQRQSKNLTKLLKMHLIRIVD